MKVSKGAKPMVPMDSKMAQMMNMMHGGKMLAEAPKMQEPMPAKKMPPRGMMEKQHAPQKRK